MNAEQLNAIRERVNAIYQGVSAGQNTDEFWAKVDSLKNDVMSIATDLLAHIADLEQRNAAQLDALRGMVAAADAIHDAFERDTYTGNPPWMLTEQLAAIARQALGDVSESNT